MFWGWGARKSRNVIKKNKNVLYTHSRHTQQANKLQGQQRSPTTQDAGNRAGSGHPFQAWTSFSKATKIFLRYPQVRAWLCRSAAFVFSACGLRSFVLGHSLVRLSTLSKHRGAEIELVTSGDSANNIGQISARRRALLFKSCRAGFPAALLERELERNAEMPTRGQGLSSASFCCCRKIKSNRRRASTTKLFSGSLGG